MLTKQSLKRLAVRRLKLRCMVTALALASLALGLLVVPGRTVQGLSAGSSGKAGWSTYADTRYDFAVEYPSDWYVVPRRDAPGWYGEVLTFSNLPSPRQGVAAHATVVNVGFYLVEIEPGQQLADWAELYDKRANEGSVAQAEAIGRASIAAPQGQGLLSTYRSSECDTRVAQTVNGSLVWFVWSNANGSELEVFKHAVSTLRFGPRSPHSLRAAYGEAFQPFRLTERALPGTTASPMSEPPPEGQGFRLPFTGWRYVTQGPTCGTHTGGYLEAIDYGLAEGENVKSTGDGTVYFAGWANDCGGNTVSISHGGTVFTSHYKHLREFRVSSGQSVSKGQVIALSGNTGSCTDGPHLHFEVRVNYGDYHTVWIRTLPTTTYYSGDPNNPCAVTDVNGFHGYAVGP